MNKLGWLHLTDLHFGLDGQRPLWPNVREAFFKDLERLHEICGPWNVVFFSGDFVQSGAEKEYHALDEMVLAPLWEHLKQLGSEPQLVAVPGNHDLLRPDSKRPNATLRQLLRPDGFREIADEFWSEPLGEYREVINSAFANYSQWWRRSPFRPSLVQDGLIPGDCSTTIEIDGVRFGVVGLNSTFLQLAPGDYRGRLHCDIRQFHGACTGDHSGDGNAWIGAHDFSILLTHQGVEWFDSASLKSYDEINPAGRFSVHLFGHEHDNIVRGSIVGGGELRWQWQGHSLFGMEKFGEPPTYDRRHGYSAGSITIDGTNCELRHWPRLATHDANGWRFERDSQSCTLDEADGGTRPIALPPRKRARQRQLNLPLQSKTLSLAQRKALDIYIGAARTLWDIVDLAGLPEDDRHLAMQRFLLRQLFVPLRLTLESTSEGDLSEESMRAMELQRLAKQAGIAGRSGLPSETRRHERFSIGERLALHPLDSSRKRQTLSRKRFKTARIPRLVILADPGGGKTTLLRWLATAYLMRRIKDPDYSKLPDIDTLPDHDWLPVLIRCRDLDVSSLGMSTIEDVLRFSLSKMELTTGQVSILVDTIREMLEKGEVLLLIDGLDEITDPQLRIKFCQWTETIAARFPSPLVVTSRIVGYRELKRRLTGGFEHTTLADLLPDDKDVFIERWCEVTIAEPPRRLAEAAKLTDAIHGRHRSDRIERMTGNPMLLTTLALVQRKVGKLPSRRHKLYWEAVGVLLNWRADVDEPMDPDEALPQLQYIAYAMCDEGVQQLRRESLLALLDSVRRDFPHIRPVLRQSPEAFLTQLERRTGLLMETGQEQHDGKPTSIYEFRHLTFQEYLAALAIVQGRMPNHDRHKTVAERVAPLAARVVRIEGDMHDELQVSENWREALRLCIACCNDDDVDAALEGILTPLNDDSMEKRPRAVLAALCLADEPNVKTETAQHVISRFVEQVSDIDGSSLMRTEIDRASIELANGPWHSLLQGALIQMFQAQPPETRASAGGVCGSMVEATPLSGEIETRSWLLDQIPRLRSPVLNEALISAVEVMVLAYEGRLPVEEDVVISLIDLGTKSPAALHASAWALAWWARNKDGQNIWIPKLTHLERLSTYLLDPKADVGAIPWLCRTMRKTDEFDPLPSLIATLSNHVVRCRESAIAVLGEIRDKRAVEALEKQLDDTDELVRTAAVAAIAAIEHDGTIQKLVAKRLTPGRPGIDPKVPISRARVRSAAKALQVPQADIRRLYEGIAHNFHLTLSWRTEAS